MYIERIDNKLILTLDEYDEGKMWSDLVDDLWQKDIEYVHSGIDGWQYLYDSYTDLVFSLDGYYYSKINDLMNNHKVELEGRPNKDEWEYWNEYEWNGPLWAIYKYDARITIKHGANTTEVRNIKTIKECENKTEMQAYMDACKYHKPITVGNMTLEVFRND